MLNNTSLHNNSTKCLQLGSFFHFIYFLWLPTLKRKWNTKKENHQPSISSSEFSSTWISKFGGLAGDEGEVFRTPLIFRAPPVVPRGLTPSPRGLTGMSSTLLLPGHKTYFLNENYRCCYNVLQKLVIHLFTTQRALAQSERVRDLAIHIKRDLD